MINLSNIITFVLHYRKDRDAFKDYSAVEIGNEVVNAIHERCFVVDTDKDNNILGVVVCTKSDEYKILHVKDILTHPTKAKGTVRRMLLEYKKLYPDYNIQAYRKGNLVRYKNTARLVSLLERLTK